MSSNQLQLPIPPVVLELSEKLIGEKCTKSLLENLNYRDVDCLKLGLSKGLGLGIVVGGSIMKVPQIIAILSAKSSEGLSLSGSILSTISYMITTAYANRNGFPFSTYGENAFLSVQDTLVSLLIILYSPKSFNKTTPFILTLSFLVGAAAFLATATPDSLSLLQVATIPLSIGSKVPQVLENFRRKSTGALSGVVVWVQVLGTIARLFTSLQEVNDPKILAAFGAALALNLVLASQIAIYGSSPSPATAAVKQKLPVLEKAAAVSSDSATASPASSRPSTPRPGTPSGSAGRAGGKKWERKLD